MPLFELLLLELPALLPPALDEDGDDLLGDAEEDPLDEGALALCASLCVQLLGVSGDDRRRFSRAQERREPDLGSFLPRRFEARRLVKSAADDERP